MKSIFSFRLRPRIALFTALGVVCLAAAEAAWADVKIVSTVSVTGTPWQGTMRRYRASQGSGPATPTPEQTQSRPQTSYPVTVTTYYKGNKARTETAGGPVTIYDGAANKVYVLYPDQKTYSVTATKQIVEQQTAPANPNAETGGSSRRVQIDTSIAFKQTDDVKTIAGKEAKKYAVTGSMKTTIERGGFQSGGFGGRHGRRGGRFPGGGGGGFPGGSGGYPAGGGGYPGGGGGGYQGGRSLPSVQMDSEFWLADAAILPAGAKSPLLPLIRQTAPFGPFLKPLNDKLSKMKLVPLSSKITLTKSSGPSDSQEPTVMTMEVTAITEEPLDDALFKAPNDYKKIDAPK